jgi:uncharacterized protein (UPF0276 family)
MKNITIATPFSELFNDNPKKQKIIDLSDVIELRHPSQAGLLNIRTIYHSELSLVVPWKERSLAGLKEILKKEKLEIISFHALSRYIENDLIGGIFIGSGEPMSIETMLNNVRDNIYSVQKIVNDNVHLLLENNNHLGSDAYDVVTEPGFLSHIIDENDMGLLFDVAHAKISAYNTRCSYKEYLNSLPLEKCYQIHLSRHAVEDGLAVDTHEALKSDDWIHFESLFLESLPNLQYATVEYYKDVDMLLDQLSLLRQIINKTMNRG